MTKVLKPKWFKCSEQAQRTFKDIKCKLTSTPILTLLSFSKVFEVDCDASGVGMGLSYLRKRGQWLSLNDAKRKYSTYDKEFYAIVRALERWWHYLVGGEFILHSNHEALKFIQGQHKLNPRHAKWVEYL